MKNIAIISLSSLFLSACMTTSYDSVVGTDSYTEVYESETVQLLPQPTDFNQNSTNVAGSGNEEVATATEVDTSMDDEWTIVEDTTTQEPVVNTTTNQEQVETTDNQTIAATDEILGVCSDQSVVTSNGQDVAMMPKFNSYLIQVISVQEQNGKVAGIEKYASNMAINYDKWKNKKLVNGAEWSTLLIGEFASADEAKNALASLSGDLTQFSPFVVSAKSVYCAGTQGLTKL